MNEHIETFIAAGEKDGTWYKTGHLQISREARINPLHPDHEITMNEIGQLATRATEHHHLNKTEAVWASTYDTEKGQSIDSNESLAMMQRLL